MTDATWVERLEPDAPDLVSAWRGIEVGRFVTVRREVRRRAGPGSADRVVAQLATTAAAFLQVLDRASPALLALPGGEGDWNVAQAIGHVAESRAGLCLAASKAATGHWPTDAPRVVPGIAGAAEADIETLRRKITQSQRIVERAARSVVGHESDPCPLEHPEVGRLRCGEWLLFAGVHDLMHLDQLHGLRERDRSVTSVAAER